MKSSIHTKKTQNIQTIAEITQINFTVPSSSAKVSAIEK